MHRHSSILRAIGIVALAILFVPVVALSQQEQAETEDAPDPRVVILGTEAYLTPPPLVLDAVMATQDQPLRLTGQSPTENLFLHAVSAGFPTLASFAKPSYDLGQFMIDPAANRQRRMTTRTSAGLEVYDAEGALVSTIQVPEGAGVTAQRWSPDGSQIAFFANFDDATHIYVADPRSGESRRITSTPVLASWVTSFDWSDDGGSIVTVLLPADRGPEPMKPEVPETPKVRVTTPDRNRLRTYFDLLESPYEIRLVEYHSTGQLASIDVASGDATPIGEPAPIRAIDAAPGGDYYRVTTMKDDISYIVPVSSAGRTEVIWNAAGEAVAEIDDTDVNEQAITNGGQRGPGGGGRGGFGGNPNSDDKRGLTWRNDGDAGMVFLQREPRPESDEEAEQEDAEEEEEAEPRTDRVMYWMPPFGDDDIQVVYETEDPINNLRFDESGRMMFLTRRSNGTETVHAVSLDGPGEEHLIYEEDTDDTTADQGALVGGGTPGSVLVSPDGSLVFLSGTQYFDDPMTDAPRPFLDSVEILSGDKQRIWQSSPDAFERFTAKLNDDLTEVIISRESPTMPPNQFRVNIETGSETQITNNPDRHPEITNARRERFAISRADGFSSRVTVTLPANYREGTKLPAMFWFYPREYTGQDNYDERFETFNKNTFANVNSRAMSILTLLGYALIEPDLPIVGPEGQRNDEYPHDLRNTLAAVIDEIDARGWIDRSRLGIGGHSYGAFGTANAMIQTPFFRAGIAGDGNYNRSLTPAGFQSERRMLWEAQDLYIEMSPFFQADRLSGAMLMYHGADDHNVGTAPIHAERMFHALEVLGKPAALYKYPFEDHGPATKETTLDLWARWVAWLDLYVMNPAGTESDTNNDGSVVSRSGR